MEVVFLKGRECQRRSKAPRLKKKKKGNEVELLGNLVKQEGERESGGQGMKRREKEKT